MAAAASARARASAGGSSKARPTPDQTIAHWRHGRSERLGLDGDEMLVRVGPQPHAVQSFCSSTSSRPESVMARNKHGRAPVAAEQAQR